MKGGEEMSESAAVMMNGWSTLDTVDDFDVGLNSSSKDILTTNETISKTIVKSLFIESLIDQLCKLLEKDPVKRHKLYEGICSKLHEMHLIEDTYNIEELASLRGHYQQALLDVMLSPDARLCSMPCFKFGSSRYATEYEEICFIASGGFGQVFKARNKLDQVVYAVKKISLKYQNIGTFGRKLNEVKTLAKLNHTNIVQYKAAWLEPTFNVIPPIPPADVNNISSTDSDIVLFQSTNSESNNSVSPEDNEKNLPLCKYQRGSIQRPVPQMSALLYVLMQLCDETLCERLIKRNLYNQPLDIRLILHIMTHTVAGIQYIHSCNIVHHDVKPRNIFLSSDLKTVQVGDFGLSCCLQGHDHADCPLEVGQFGTPLYAAPEQLRGRCDPKSDMFSLGLIFVELLTVFSTEMERVKILTKARSGELPTSIPEVLVPVIKNLISHKPSKRPSADELMIVLQKLHDINFNETNAESVRDGGIMSEVPAGENLVNDKDKEIIELRQMLAQKESEIAELKNLIKKISI